MLFRIIMKLGWFLGGAIVFYQRNPDLVNVHFGYVFFFYRNEEWNCQSTVNNGTLRHPYIVMMPTQLWHQ